MCVAGIDVQNIILLLYSLRQSLPKGNPELTNKARLPSHLAGGGEGRNELLREMPCLCLKLQGSCHDYWTVSWLLGIQILVLLLMGL